MTACGRSEALFDALLKIAVTEAYEKELDALPGDEALSGCIPSPVLHRRIMSLIQRGYRKAVERRVIKKLGKAAACLCIILTVSSIVLMSVGATRNAIFNALIRWNEQYTEIQFGDASVNDSFYRPLYLPEGFGEKSVEASASFTTIVYMNSSGVKIVFDQQPAGTGTTLIDNENTDYVGIQLSGNPGYLFEAKTKSDSSVLIWEEEGVVFELMSTISREELVRIGESIKNN